MGWSGALRDPRFRRLFAGQALSSFGDSALYLTLGIWAKTLTGSNAAAGGVFLALAAPNLLAPLAGHLADRVRRRTLLIAVNAVTALIVLSLVFVRSRDELWLIYVVAFCYGASFNLLSAAGSGLRKDMLRGEDLASANAALQMASQGLRVLSPLAGAGLFVAFGGPSVAIFDTVTFLAAIVATASLRISESEPDKERGSFWLGTVKGFTHIRAVPLLARLSLASAIAFSVVGVSETVIFAVVGEGLHRAPSFMGVMLSVQGGGSIAAGLTAASLMRRAGAARTAGLALGCFALNAVAYQADSLPLVLGGAVLDGLGVVWLSVGVFTAMQEHTPPRLQGRVSAAARTLLITPQTLSIAAGAALISVVSYRLLLLVMVIVIGACAAWLLARPAETPDPAQAADPGTAGEAAPASLPARGAAPAGSRPDSAGPLPVRAVTETGADLPETGTGRPCRPAGTAALPLTGPGAAPPALRRARRRGPQRRTYEHAAQVQGGRAAVERSLDGMQVRAHHPLLIRTHLDHIALLDRSVAAIEDEIEAALDAIPAALGITADGVPSPDPGPDAAALPAAERLAEIPGVSLKLARAIIAETGLDMTRFPTADHLVSRAGLAPVARQSGPRSRRPGKGQGDAYLKGYCTQAAAGAARTETFLGERLRRLSRRPGALRARCAVARSILTIVWHLLNDPAARFRDLGADWHERRSDRDRKIRAHLRQLQALGLDVTITPAAV